jgi:hypothetical protein
MLSAETRFRSVAVIALLLCAGCHFGISESGSQQPSDAAPSGMGCGNGVCVPPESAARCPADCAEDSPADTAPSGSVLYYGIMVHLEGWDDARSREKFEQHAALVRRYAALFESYGARLTLESKEFTDGCIAWGDNVLREMEDRGHGIGVHADIGGEPDMVCETFTPQLRNRKQVLESLGVRVWHVSGIVSHCDWVAAAADAGYAFASGTVAYALMSLPAELRPEGFADCPSPAACHQAYPFDLAGRMHPWRMGSGADWTIPDPDGRLVILPSGGGLPCAAEEAGADESYTRCDFNAADVDALIAELERILTLVDSAQFNMYYISWSIGKQLDDSLLEDFLRRVKPFVDGGRVAWKTLPEMYDLYLAWEVGR